MLVKVGEITVNVRGMFWLSGRGIRLEILLKRLYNLSIQPL